MGKRTVRFVTLYAIQTLFLTKACCKTFKIQSGILDCNSQKVVYLLKCRILVKLLMLVRQRRNLESDLVTIKGSTGPIENNVKYHSSVLMNIMGNTDIMGLMISSSY